MAGLIPQAFIDDLLQRTNIVEVVSRRVSDLKKKGRNHTACCPFHQEKTPSFSVNEDRQFYYCFGCGAGGNAIGFVMNFESLDFPQAVESLARDAGLEVPREQSRAAARKQSENKGLLDILVRADRFYQQQLRRHPDKQAAVDYLKSRGLSGEIARDFGLGFAPPGWDNLLTNLGGDQDAEQTLLKAGLIVEKENRKEGAGQQYDQSNDRIRRYYDRFRHRIMFPIRNTRGDTVAFGGRVLGDDKPKYLNSPETPVFHKGSELYGLYEAKRARTRSQGAHSELKTTHSELKSIIIVEGYMDVIALAQTGVRNAVATLGTATSSKHLTRLFRLVPEVVFCFDGDAAGRTAAWRALETTLPLLEDGRQVRFLFLPEGTDPDTFVRQHGSNEFIEAANKATPLEQFFFDKLSADLDLDSIEGRARLSNLAKPLLRKLPRGVYAQLMLDRLSELLGVAGESLDKLMSEQPRQTEPPPPAPFISQPPFHNQTPASRRPGADLQPYRRPASLKAIELLLRNPEIALSLDQDLEPLRQSEDEGRKLLLSLIEMVRRDPHTEPYTLVGYCYGTALGAQLTRLLKGEKITPQEGVEQEFKQIIDNILSDIKKQLDHLQLRDKLEARFSAAKERN